MEQKPEPNYKFRRGLLALSILGSVLFGSYTYNNRHRLSEKLYNFIRPTSVATSMQIMEAEIPDLLPQETPTQSMLDTNLCSPGTHRGYLIVIRTDSNGYIYYSFDADGNERDYEVEIVDQTPPYVASFMIDHNNDRSLEGNTILIGYKVSPNLLSETTSIQPPTEEQPRANLCSPGIHGGFLIDQKNYEYGNDYSFNVDEDRFAEFTIFIPTKRGYNFRLWIDINNDNWHTNYDDYTFIGSW